MTHDYMEFNKVLEDTDYGIIVNKDGRIKGIWIPRNLEGEEIPATISRLCIEYFGIDPNDDSNYQTLH
jgi:hypothetical protein